MNATNSTLKAALAGVMTLGVLATGGHALAQQAGANERCAGIVKAGKNDCGTSYSSCAGTSKKDNDAEAWIYVPKGTCERIVGGRIQTSSYAKKGGKG